MTKRVDDLSGLICGSPEHPLAAVLRSWCLASRPVTDFMAAHASKLRRKVRLASSGDERGDLLAELAVGRLLARDRHVQVQYEPRPAETRGPDFLATFRGHLPVYVEVTRLRSRPEDGGAAALKLARVLCDKVSQGVAGEMNVLAVILPEELQTEALVPEAIRLLQAPQRLLALGAGWTPERLSGFQRSQGRLSGVVLYALTPEGDL